MSRDARRNLRAVEQRPARQTHYLEVARSNRAGAPNLERLEFLRRTITREIGQVCIGTPFITTASARLGVVEAHRQGETEPETAVRFDGAGQVWIRSRLIVRVPYGVRGRAA